MPKACNLPFSTDQVIYTGFNLCLKIGSYDLPIQEEIYPQYFSHDKHGNSKIPLRYHSGLNFQVIVKSSTAETL